MRVALDNGRLLVSAGPRDTNYMKMVPGARARRGSAYEWQMPATLAQAVALDSLFPEIEPTPAAAAWFNERMVWAEAQIARKNQHPNQAPGPEMPDGKRLFPYQMTAVRFLLGAGSALVADGCGVGKTAESLSVARAAGAKRVLVLCPGSVKHKWIGDAETWWPEAEGVVFEGSKVAREKRLRSALDTDAPLVVSSTYETAKAHTWRVGFGTRASDGQRGILNEVEWDYVILDEAHRIKDPRAQRSRAAHALGRGAKNRLALTGTPIVQTPGDLWSIMHFVAPDEWPDYGRYITRYCVSAPGYHGGLEIYGFDKRTRQELDTFVEPRFIRRELHEVRPQQPKRMPDDVWDLDLAPKQRKAYNDMKRHMLAEAEGGVLIAADPLATVTRLRQISGGVPVLDDDGNVVGLTGPSCKAEALFDFIEGAPDEPVVAFAESRLLIEYIGREMEKKKLRVGYVTGAYSDAAKHHMVQEFQAGNLDYLLCTYGSGAEGLDMYRARFIVELEESFSNRAKIQASHRIDRVGQERQPQVVTFRAKGTMDEAAAVAVQYKNFNLQDLLRDKQRLAKAMDGVL